jgi:hypothetical protein
MKRTQKVWPGVLMALALLCVPALAHADFYQGYVCYAEYNPAASSYVGNYGHVNFDLYSGPNCTGSYQVSIDYNTTGASENTFWQYSELGINNLFQAVLGAMKSNIRVYFWTYGGGTTDPGPPNFSAN